MRQVLDGAYSQMMHGNYMLANAWRNDILFSWRWWVIVSLTVLPWVAVWMVAPGEKRRFMVISGFIAMLLSSVFDVFGLSYDLWRYYVVPFPMMGGFFPWNLSVIPVGMSLVDWIWPRGRPIWRGLLYALVGAFVAEPLADAFGFTNHLRWSHAYSLPIYLLIYLVATSSGKKLLFRTHGEVEPVVPPYRHAFEHSFDAMYLIEKNVGEKQYRFGEVNDTFCKEMGYSREELIGLDPRIVSDQENYNPNIKYRPLLQAGNMNTETTFVTKFGEKKYVRLKVKVFESTEKIEILTIARFSEKAVVQDQVT